ncbi:YibE/F family protein [Propionispira raffinosivorans]|uniref:YibE/F family protein n=1 Tax=Propionispira raffinosivorans TaxID=86959 RepID=UPI0003651D0E|nr:YibE/F family protein [Propionispira raffinosivorans]
MRFSRLKHKRIYVWLGTIAILVGLATFLYIFQQVEKPVLVNTGGRTFENATVLDILEDNMQENGMRIGDQKVRLQIDSGVLSGKTVEATSANGFLFGAACTVGGKVVAIVSLAGDSQMVTVYSVNRALPIYAFIGFFLLSLCVIGGKKGMKSAGALIFTMVCIVYLFLPMLVRGISPFLAASITAVVTVTVSLSLIGGLNRKTLAAILGTFFGVVIAGTSAAVFGYFASISGYNVSNIEALLFVGQNTKIDIGGLLFAGVLIATLGAVMDIAMDIAAAVSEVHDKTPQLTRRQLFESGMNVGRDIMGTMATTLILAFTGSSLGILVLNYVYDLPYRQVLNSNSMGIEIMQGISGSLGVVFTVPMVAVMAALLLKKASAE